MPQRRERKALTAKMAGFNKSVPCSFASRAALIRLHERQPSC